MNVFNVNDNYFKYQKCLSGITYQFVNQLDNIYDKNLMVGTNYCIYCMYNEYDIINNFMVNLYQVDVCSTINLDITNKYYNIDDAYLRTGHRVLLSNQINPVENDVYIVDTKGFLILSDELADTGRTWRYKAYVKLGTNKGKQFHLKNSGNRFPLKGERKYFMSGHGYIIKNSFNYNLFVDNPILPKLIFTDYELSRISVNKNYELYSGFPFVTGNTIDIQYHGGSYLITVDEDTTKYVSTGTTTVSTIYNSSGLTMGNGYETYIEVDPNFILNVNVYDYIKLEISGSTNLYLKSFVKEIGTTYVVISDYISDYILYNYYTGTTSTYNLTNLMYSPQVSIRQTMLESFYSKYFQFDVNNLLPKQNDNNLYFDYDGLKFEIDSNTYEFSTTNHYIKYQLYNHLNLINDYVFNSGYSFLIDFSTSGYSLEYYDGRNIEYWNPIVYPDTYGDTMGTLIKIIPNTPSDVNYFKKNTYINIINNSNKYKTLIVDLVPNEYLIIETYKSNTGFTIDSIETLYNLKEISEILYDIYINDITPINTDYYRLRSDNTRRDICNGYADFISKDIEIIDNVTAILMQDDKHKFILKIYDPENLSNGGVIRTPYVITKLGEIHTSTSAILPGEVIDDGGTNITERGICWSSSSVDILGNTNNNISQAVGTSIGPYTSNIYPLTPLSTYYYKAYARDEHGLSYGEVYSFTTSSPNYTAPVVTTDNVIVNSNNITVNSTVIDIGYLPISSRGIVYVTGVTTPVIGGIDVTGVTYSPEDGLIGPYTIYLNGLLYNTIYSYNAFAMNVCGTTYGLSGYTSTGY